jgi:predicted dehydrogenase
VTSFAVVGSGWRAEMFWRLADGLPGVECLGAVVRTPRELPVPVLGSLDDVRPDFVVTAVPWDANPSVVADAAARGLPVLSETPPAPDRAGLEALWAAAGGTGLVQVAEQYLLVPAHAARLAAVRAGLIGTPTQVQVSSTHQYHAVSLIRGYLGGTARTPVTVRATRTTAPLVDPLTRDGWTGDDTPAPATTTIATLDFGDGRSGLYDFTGNQWHNQLRFRRLLVRGTHGELRDDEVVRLAGPETIVRTPIVRRQTGYDLDLDGYETDHLTLGDRVLYRNPYPGRRWNDEEIAIASQLDAMAAWVRGDGPPPYPLADGAHDHLIALAIEEAAGTDRTVTTAPAPWA